MTNPQLEYYETDLFRKDFKKLAKKFRTLPDDKGRGNKSGIRIIYAYHVVTLHVVFLEIYFKADQENEDRTRIREYLSSSK
jgi:hypothetical protein